MLWLSCMDRRDTNWDFLKLLQPERLLWSPSMSFFSCENITFTVYFHMLKFYYTCENVQKCTTHK